MTINRARTICLYGSTGTFKTTAVGHFAKAQYEKSGLPTRLISADLGGWHAVQHLVDAGIIEAVHLGEREDLLGYIRKLSRGSWPAVDGAGRAGGTDNGPAPVGGYAIEGLTSISLLLLRHLANKGQKINEDVVGSFTEGGEKFAAPGRSHYGFVQNMILDLITDFSSLPVERVLFTAHEGKGTDEFSKQLVYGPASVGQAATTRIPPYVGDLIHFDTIQGRQGNKDTIEVRGYFSPHPDPQTRVLWPAKVRFAPEAIPILQRRWPEGYFPLTLEHGLDEYLRLQDEVAEAGAQEAREWKATIDNANSK